MVFLGLSIAVAAAAVPVYLLARWAAKIIPSWLAWLVFVVWVWPAYAFASFWFLFRDGGRAFTVWLLRHGLPDATSVSSERVWESLRALFSSGGIVVPDAFLYQALYAGTGFAVGLVFVAIGFSLGVDRRPEQESHGRPRILPTTYRSQPVLNRAEAAMLRSLRQIAEQRDLLVLSKVRLVDLVSPVWAPGTAPSQTAWNAVAQKHVDFVLVETFLYMPVLVLELDGRSHQDPQQRARDERKDAALAAAGVPVLRVPPGAEADRSSFETLVLSRISASRSAPPSQLGEAGLEVTVEPIAPGSIGEYLQHMAEGHTWDGRLKLEVEIVPSSCWYSNLRSLIPPGAWDRIRKSAYAAAGYQCEICGARGRLECHERWEYDDANRVQRLGGFVALCRKCHAVKHIGLAGIRASRGEEDYEALIQHFMSVNSVSREVFDEHVEEAFRVWRERSRYAWRTDLGSYADLVATHGSSGAEA